MEKKVMKTKEAAAYLGICACKLRVLAKDGKIAYICDGEKNSAFRFLVTDLNDYLSQFRHAAREKLVKYLNDNDVHPYVDGGQPADLNLK